MKSLKMFVVLASLLILSGCGAHGTQTASPYQNSGSFNGKFCGLVNGQTKCVQTLEPAACAGADLFSSYNLVGKTGEEVISTDLTGNYEPVTITSGVHTLTVSNISYTLKAGPKVQYGGGQAETQILEFAPGCELNFQNF